MNLPNGQNPVTQEDPPIPLGQEPVDDDSISVVEEEAGAPPVIELAATDLYQMYNDDKRLPPGDRLPFLFGLACSGLVENFTLN